MSKGHPEPSWRAHWMETLTEELRDVPLVRHLSTPIGSLTRPLCTRLPLNANTLAVSRPPSQRQVCLPGTHDSGAYALDHHVVPGQSFPPWLASLLNSRYSTCSCDPAAPSLTQPPMKDSLHSHLPSLCAYLVLDPIARQRRTPNLEPLDVLPRGSRIPSVPAACHERTVQPTATSPIAAGRVTGAAVEAQVAAVPGVQQAGDDRGHRVVAGAVHGPGGAAAPRGALPGPARGRGGRCVPLLSPSARQERREKRGQPGNHPDALLQRLQPTVPLVHSGAAHGRRRLRQLLDLCLRRAY